MNKQQVSEPIPEKARDDSASWREAPLLMLKGFLMGSADIVPGVSGGTMALIVGIYSRLIHAIKSFDTSFARGLLRFRWRESFAGVHWKFMAILLVGIFAAILFFTKVVPLQVYMFTDPELVFGLFFGLIVGSIFILVKALDAFTWMHGGMLLLGALFGFWVVTLVPTETSTSSWFVFVSGAVAICAMILPGISGSYLLLILRKYDFMLSQVGKLGTGETVAGILGLLPFLAGAVVGLALFSRLLSWLLDHYYGRTIAVLIGFLIGSLYVIWPYQHRDYTDFVIRTETVAYGSKAAQALREDPPETNRPEFKRLGEVSGTEGERMVELQTVKKKLVSTEPFVPYFTVEGAGTPHFWKGILGMAIGLLMVVGLDYIREEP